MCSASGSLAYLLEGALIADHPGKHRVQCLGSVKAAALDTSQQKEPQQQLLSHKCVVQRPVSVSCVRQYALAVKARPYFACAHCCCMCFVFCCHMQTWRSAGWPFGQHDGVFVQLHASLKQAIDSSSSSGPDQQAQDAAAGGRSSEGVLRKLWFIKFRENKPPV